MASFTIILYIDHIRDVNITTYLICHLYSSPSIPCFITQYPKYCGSVADLSLFFRGSVIVLSWFCHGSVMIHHCCHGSVSRHRLLTRRLSCESWTPTPRPGRREMTQPDTCHMAWNTRWTTSRTATTVWSRYIREGQCEHAASVEAVI